jgi:hypothetical protein
MNVGFSPTRVLRRAQMVPNLSGEEAEMVEEETKSEVK